MKKKLIYVAVVFALLSIGFNTIYAQKTMGKPVSDSVSSTLFGGCCTGMKEVSCTGACDSSPWGCYVDADKYEPPSGTEFCGGETTCGHHYPEPEDTCSC